MSGMTKKVVLNIQKFGDDEEWTIRISCILSGIEIIYLTLYIPFIFYYLL